jgi:hypothetical protein
MVTCLVSVSILLFHYCVQIAIMIEYFEPVWLIFFDASILHKDTLNSIVNRSLEVYGAKNH